MTFPSLLQDHAEFISRTNEHNKNDYRQYRERSSQQTVIAVSAKTPILHFADGDETSVYPHDCDGKFGSHHDDFGTR
jgi:hypothetical protein